jgi:hypothetical protein
MVMAVLFHARSAVTIKPKANMKEIFIAWAINANSDEGHGFIGRYWWFTKRADMPVHMEGCKVALFKTRKLARENLSSVKRSFPAARVEKVIILIDTQKLKRSTGSPSKNVNR